MAKIENQPKVILTQAEIAILNETRKILTKLNIDDDDGYIFDKCDNCDIAWYWIDTFIKNLVNISEVEQNV